MAFNKSTGELVWMNGTRPLPEDTTYSTPILTVLGGQKAMVFGAGDGSLWAFQPRTGKSIWEFQLSKRGMDISPVAVGDTIYMSHSEENIDINAQGAAVGLSISATASQVRRRGNHAE
jgi:outer membrane protein assembly factor BamB